MSLLGEAAFESFAQRHLGPRGHDQKVMLESLGLSSLDQLMDRVIPKSIRAEKKLNLPEAQTEFELLKELSETMEQNQVYRSYLGMGYSDSITPGVIQRNILENPGWYTQYTPYQAEISQGRLEALLNFQTMVTSLTGLEIANASLLDEATAAAEAMTLCLAAKGNVSDPVFLVSDLCHPQVIEVVRTRAEPLEIQVKVQSHEKFEWSPSVFGVLLQYPATDGRVIDYSSVISKAKESGALTVMAADLLSLTLLRSPGEWGADVALGSTQRFGLPMGFGGPHAAYLATKEAYKRLMPGRIVGVSKDAEGRQAYRLALQTREQHIRRDKATSNICTSQVLLAVIASMYAVYHGPEGLKKIATRIHRLTQMLARGLKKQGFEVSESFFDTISVKAGKEQSSILKRADAQKINLRALNSETISVALDEVTQEKDLEDLLKVFGPQSPISLDSLTSGKDFEVSDSFLRKTPYLEHPIFQVHRSETEMLRYIRRLESRDLSLTSSMIPLGSCTMKLNATAEMFPVTWPKVAKLHPFVPSSQTKGYQVMLRDLEKMLSEITGFDATSLQPNAGSQGEYAGLLVIRAYHESRGDRNRNVCLIPMSAHGTNPASAAMVGMKVVVVNCDRNGNVDVEDLRKKATEHAPNLAALMVTYPSTHGVFETAIREICEIVHQKGGQVYMDGANMNAQVGYCRPGDYGPDVCHLNLHKTFAIPHGGGGPGMGPICVKKHLAPFLPSHPLVQTGGERGVGAISAAPFGSASILPISWSYIRLLGKEGIAKATAVAILNANYVAKRLNPHYPVLYKGEGGFVAHECIVDLRELKKTAGIEVEDVAKRLMDYGFHAPTISFPVAGTMMIEPTESESLEEMDRFCEAMIEIRKEIEEIEKGKIDSKNNPLKRAPHTASQIAQDDEIWARPYSRQKAAFPLSWVRDRKFWPHVTRIDNVYGDRNLICTCPSLESYSDA